MRTLWHQIGGNQQPENRTSQQAAEQPAAQTSNQSEAAVQPVEQLTRAEEATQPVHLKKPVDSTVGVAITRQGLGLEGETLQENQEPEQPPRRRWVPVVVVGVIVLCLAVVGVAIAGVITQVQQQAAAKQQQAKIAQAVKEQKAGDREATFGKVHFKVTNYWNKAPVKPAGAMAEGNYYYIGSGMLMVSRFELEGTILDISIIENQTARQGVMAAMVESFSDSLPDSETSGEVNGIPYVRQKMQANISEERYNMDIAFLDCPGGCIIFLMDSPIGAKFDYSGALDATLQSIYFDE